MGQVVITRTTGGLGRRAQTEDQYSGLVMSVKTAPSGLALGTVAELDSLKDAEDLGITAAYDTADVVLAHYHISEFFRMNPNGKLFILLGDQDTETLAVMADKANDFAKKLLRSPEADGKIRQVAIARNPAAAYTPTITDGLDADSHAAIPKAQALAAEEETLHRPVVFIIEGRSFSGTIADLDDLRSLSADAPQVCVCIGQDKDVGDVNALYAGHACVGTLLGLMSRRKVNENVGWVADGNIQSAADEAFLNPALSSNALITAYTSANFTTLDTKGYIYPKTYVGRAGVYFNDSYTCIALTDDFFSIENNRTIQKAIRLVYARLLPHVNSSVRVDPTTGKLAPSTCKYFEEEANSELKDMETDGEISGFDAWCDPDQDILSTDTLTVNIQIVPTGVARTISVPIGFSNPFN